MATIYKCPSCGGNMLFDADTSTLKCENCQQEMEISAYEQMYAKKEENTYEDQGQRQYRCPSCGATLVTDTYTAATTCAYCGSPNVIEEQVENRFQPDVVIPFRFDKNQAIDKMKKWCHGGLLTPSDFYSKSAVTQKLQGIYVPFWLYDLDTESSLMAQCERIKVRRSGKTEITTYYKYHVSRQGRATFANIPRDASKKMDNQKMDLLEPFDIRDMKEFQGAYLSGYSAERYSESKEEVYPRAMKIASQYAIDELKSTISGYDTVTLVDSNADVKCKNIKYAMYPVWHYEYTYHDKLYEFMMNGQTGKVVGKPPVSVGKAIFLGTSLFISTFAFLAALLMYL